MILEYGLLELSSMFVHPSAAMAYLIALFLGMGIREGSKYYR